MNIGTMIFGSVLMAVLMFMSIITKCNRKSKSGIVLVLSILFGFIGFGIIIFISDMVMQIPEIFIKSKHR